MKKCTESQLWIILLGIHYRSVHVHRDFMASQTRRQCPFELTHLKEYFIQLLPPILLPYEGKSYWQPSRKNTHKLLRRRSFQSYIEHYRTTGWLLVPRIGSSTLQSEWLPVRHRRSERQWIPGWYCDWWRFPHAWLSDMQGLHHARYGRFLFLVAFLFSAFWLPKKLKDYFWLL